MSHSIEPTEDQLVDFDGAMLVLQYGVLRPDGDSAELLHNQLRFAHDYRVVLTRIERLRRKDVRELYAKYSDIEALEKAVASTEATLQDAIKIAQAEKVQTGKKKASEIANQRIKEARAAKKEAEDSFRLRRMEKRNDKEFWLALNEINERANEQKKEARKSATNLFWGSKQLVEMACDASFKDTPLYSEGEPNDPPFPRFDGSGNLGVQVMHTELFDERPCGVPIWASLEHLTIGKAPAFFAPSLTEPIDVAGERKTPFREVKLPDGRSGFIRVESLRQGLRAEHMFAKNNFGWIDPVDERAWNDRSGGEGREHGKGKRPPMRTQLHMRVAPADGDTETFVTLPMVMHRPIPAGARVKRLTLSKKKRGPQDEWTVQITVDMKGVKRIRTCGQGAVAMDVGWRQIDDELRVFHWTGQDGKSGEIRLSEKMIGSLRKNEDLQSTRSKNLDALKEKLIPWLEANKAKLPDWLRETVDSRAWNTRQASLPEDKRSKKGWAHISSWRSERRFASLARRWEQDRFDGDSVGDELLVQHGEIAAQAAQGRKEVLAEARAAGKSRKQSLALARAKHPHPNLPCVGLEGFAAIQAWAIQDRHLWEWQENQRINALRQRREFHRLVAVKLATQYETLILEDFDLSKMAKRPKVGEEKAKDSDTARSNRHMSAPGEFRTILIQAFRARGGHEEWQSAVNTTRECHVCGSVEIFDAAAQINHTCVNGHEWDQDANADRVMLARHLRGVPPIRKKKREDKWKRVDRLKDEKEEKKAAFLAETAVDAAE